MKIELIELKFNDTYSYKYKPFKHCCEAIQDDKAIIFTNEDLFPKYDCDDYDVYVPQFCTSYSETLPPMKMNLRIPKIIQSSFVLIVEKRYRFRLQMRLIYLINMMN